MNTILFTVPRKYGSRLFSILSIVTASFIMTGCATNATQVADDSTPMITKPSERVAIKYKNLNNNINDLPPEVASFLNDGKIDYSKISTVTPTKIGKGSYNHEILNNAKATDIVAIDPTKFAPPIALPDYGVDENLETPVDFVAQAPAYFAAVQPPQIVTRTKSYASIQSVNKSNSRSNTKTNVKIAKSNKNIKSAPSNQRVKVNLIARKK